MAYYGYVWVLKFESKNNGLQEAPRIPEETRGRPEGGPGYPPTTIIS